MRPTSRVFRARQVAAEIESGACKGLGVWWSQQEAAHAAATTKQEAEAAAQPAVDICSSCIELDHCELLAQLDRSR